MQLVPHSVLLTMSLYNMDVFKKFLSPPLNLGIFIVGLAWVLRVWKRQKILNRRVLSVFIGVLPLHPSAVE